jgi:hypothetical protein
VCTSYTGNVNSVSNNSTNKQIKKNERTVLRGKGKVSTPHNKTSNKDITISPLSTDPVPQLMSFPSSGSMRASTFGEGEVKYITIVFFNENLKQKKILIFFSRIILLSKN